MAGKEIEAIEIDDCYSSPDEKDTHLRPILCAKNKDDIKKFEKTEDCFILEFDPFDEIDIMKLSLFDYAGAADLCVVAEKGQVACRDYPHSRHTCAKHPFEKTPHYSHCDRCYCYVCDSAAPCKEWGGLSGHCHAFNTEFWDKKREARKLKASHKEVARGNRPHFRHKCAEYPFVETPHDSHCKLCRCYVCNSTAPCRKWLGSSGHCHAFKTELWKKKRAIEKLLQVARKQEINGIDYVK